MLGEWVNSMLGGWGQKTPPLRPQHTTHSALSTIPTQPSVYYPLSPQHTAPALYLLHSHHTAYHSPAYPHPTAYPQPRLSSSYRLSSAPKKSQKQKPCHKYSPFLIPCLSSSLPFLINILSRKQKNTPAPKSNGFFSGYPRVLRPQHAV